MKAEDILEVNENLKSIDLKGKGYVQVHERIKAFRSICPNGTIKTEILNYDDESITMMTSILDEDGRLLATGYARENKDASFVNKTSYVENCETSAVGRALGMVGIGIDSSMATAEEVANAIIGQANAEAPKKEAPKKDTPKKGKVAPKAEPETDATAGDNDETHRKVTEEEVKNIIAGCRDNGVEVAKICRLYKKTSLPELSVFQYKHIFNNWDRIKRAD